jgi:hypothetical protein
MSCVTENCSNQLSKSVSTSACAQGIGCFMKCAAHNSVGAIKSTEGLYQARCTMDLYESKMVLILGCESRPLSIRGHCLCESLLYSALYTMLTSLISWTPFQTTQLPKMNVLINWKLMSDTLHYLESLPTTDLYKTSKLQKTKWSACSEENCT